MSLVLFKIAGHVCVKSRTSTPFDARVLLSANPQTEGLNLFLFFTPTPSDSNKDGFTNETSAQQETERALMITWTGLPRFQDMLATMTARRSLTPVPWPDGNIMMRNEMCAGCQNQRRKSHWTGMLTRLLAFFEAGILSAHDGGLSAGHLVHAHASPAPKCSMISCLINELITTFIDTALRT